mgnify:CR=1 FL=1
MQNKAIKILQSATTLTALRWVVGWTYFSALWRRLVLDFKLDPEAANYVGVKFNHFLPNALGIGDLIEYLVSNPDLLWVNMVAFTVIEGIVGLFLIFGFATRLASIGTVFLAIGILLGSGWLGTTCLDEWQIGILGIASGIVLFFSGSGKWSMDNYLLQKEHKLSRKKFFPWLFSGTLPWSERKQQKTVLFASIFAVFTALGTNQYFHAGVWGDLHNLSKKPKLELSEVQYKEDVLSLNVMRVEGIDVYGSFVTEIAVLKEEGLVVQRLTSEDFNNEESFKIVNHYVAKTKVNQQSLMLPLGALATLEMKLPALEKGTYILRFKDISDASWSINFTVD